jgi:hypothetical protein
VNGSPLEEQAIPLANAGTLCEVEVVMGRGEASAARREPKDSGKRLSAV